MSHEIDDEKKVSRRDFLGLATAGAAAVAIIGSLAVLLRLIKPQVLPDPSSTFRIGAASDFPPGTDRVIPEHQIRVVATDSGIAAVSLICTHLGCIVSHSEEGYVCPCHGSRFDSDGEVTNGPALRALKWLAISQAADGALVVDKGTEVKLGEYYKV